MQDKLTVADFADAWMELTRTSADRASDDLFRKGFQLNDLAYDDPPLAWAIIREVVGRFSFEEFSGDAETDGKHVLANLGAGPLEVLLAQHGSDYISVVEQAAIDDPRFFWMLGCVWRNVMDEQTWQRVKRAARVSR